MPAFPSTDYRITLSSCRYEDYLQSLVKRAVGLVEEDDSELLVGLHFQLTLALLWTVVSCLNLPTLMAWTQVTCPASFQPNSIYPTNQQPLAIQTLANP